MTNVNVNVFSDKGVDRQSLETDIDIQKMCVAKKSEMFGTLQGNLD